MATATAAAKAAKTTTTAYSTLPTPLPPSLSNQSFQAGRISELGNQIQLDGADRKLQSVTVGMVTLGYYSKYNPLAVLKDVGGWNCPVKLSLYAVNAENPNLPGELIASVTQTLVVPWRPEPDPDQCGTGSTKWHAADGCHNGFLFPAVFDFTSQAPTLPDQVIFGVAYDTQSAGQNPMGIEGPYNDLNVGVYATNTAGSNVIAPEAFLNGTIGQSYADNGAGGTGIFRRDTGSTHTSIAIQFDMIAAAPSATEEQVTFWKNAFLGIAGQYLGKAWPHGQAQATNIIIQEAAQAADVMLTMYEERFPKQ